MLGRGGAADRERAVVARLVAHVGLDDVEVGLIARPDDAVREVVRVRTATLSRDGIDRFDAVRTHFVEPARRPRDDLVLPHARLERFVDILISAVTHRRRHVEERNLVVTLDLARVEHHLLAVLYDYAQLLKRKEEWRLDHVYAERHSSDAFACENVVDFLRGGFEQSDLRGYRTAQPGEPCQPVVLRQPGRVESVM